MALSFSFYILIAERNFMTDGERLLDTNVLVHAYVRLDEKKQVAARSRFVVQDIIARESRNSLSSSDCCL